MGHLGFEGFQYDFPEKNYSHTEDRDGDKDGQIIIVGLRSTIGNDWSHIYNCIFGPETDSKLGP